MHFKVVVTGLLAAALLYPDISGAEMRLGDYSKLQQLAREAPGRYHDLLLRYWLDGLATGIVRRDNISPGNFCASNLGITAEVMKSVINQYLATQTEVAVTDDTPMGIIAMLAVRNAFPCNDDFSAPRADGKGKLEESGMSLPP